MKDSVSDMDIERDKKVRSRIVCDLSDCGCKSSTMIWVSHPLKAIWFETPKTASSSVKKMLGIIRVEPPGNRSTVAKLFGWQTKWTKRAEFQFEMWPGDEYEVIREYPDYFKFAIVRNPWDRMVSNWSMFCRAGIADRERKIETLFGKTPGDIRFDEFIRRSVYIRNHHWQQLVDFLPRDGNKLLIDFLGRMETLEGDWKEINRKLGIDVELLFDNRTDHRHYRDYYNDELRDIVATSHKDDIRAFHYEF